MEKVLRGHGRINLPSSELFRLEDLKDSGVGTFELWGKINKTVLPVVNFRVSSQIQKEIIPGYLIRKDFLTVVTKDGKWLLVPGHDEYGFLEKKDEEIIKKIPGGMEKEASYTIDDSGYYLYIEKRWLVDSYQTLKKAISDLEIPWNLVFLIQKTKKGITTLDFKFGKNFYEGYGNETDNIKISKLAKFIITK